MFKKVMITAAVGAAIVGGGTAALAASGSTSSPTATTSSTTAKPTTTHTKGKHDRRVRLGRALHGTWVTKDGKGGTDAKTTSYVTHDAIHGTVSAVSSTSISVKAADGVTETYKVTSATKVRMRTAGEKKGAASSIAQVKTGGKVLVVGTGTAAGSAGLTATHVVAGLKR